MIVEIDRLSGERCLMVHDEELDEHVRFGNLKRDMPPSHLRQMLLIAETHFERKRNPTYPPFCSLACNREYHEIVVLPDTANHREPWCLNCGKRTDGEGAT
jgi:hypothetical protein